VKYNTEIISISFQCFISHVTTSEIISATLDMLENIRELQ